ncbi:unnamed protein product, partial [Symbiodinium microadriaticum]
DRAPLILQRAETPKEFMGIDRYARFDHISELQDHVRMGMREAAVDDENRKIKKKRARAPKQEEPVQMEKAKDDDEDAPAAGKKTRKTRLNKLLKGSTPKKKASSSNTKKSPKKHSPRKMKKVLDNLEKVKELEAELPGMAPPETISNQSFTRHPEKALRGRASPIGIILLAQNFYVKKVVVASDALPADKKHGCTIPWHLYGIKEG